MRVVEGAGILIGDKTLRHLGAVMVVHEPQLLLRAMDDVGLFLVVVGLK